MTSSKRKIFSVTVPLCGEPQVKVDSPHKGTATRTFDVFVVSLKKTVEQTLDWPVFRDHTTVIWLHRDVLNSQYCGCWGPDAYLAPRHLKSSWRNRTVAYLSSCIFFAKLSRGISYFAEVATLRNARDFIFAFFCDCVGVLFVMIVMQYIPAWCYFLRSVIECHQYREWHYINLNLDAASLKERLYFGYA